MFEDNIPAAEDNVLGVGDTCDSTGTSELSADNHNVNIGLGLVSALALTASACGGDNGGSGIGNSSNSSASSSSSVTLQYTSTEAARFLLQAQFSATDVEITALRSSSYTAWLTTQFNTSIAQTGTAWLSANGHGTPDASGNYFNPSFGDWMAWNQLMSGDGQLRKRLSLALSEFFVVSLSPIDGFWPPYLIAAYWDMLNVNVFGNYRTLLEEVTLNPAMGFYLNTKGNLKEDSATGRQPDENYAREVMQLFSIGLYELNLDGTPKTNSQGKPIETYGQPDISNLAHVFTGYDWDYSQVTYQMTSFQTNPIPTTQFTQGHMKFDASKHSNLVVNFLGTTIAANTTGASALKSALDTLFNHANTGPFFAKQMIQRLVTSNPSPAYVSRVATIFNNNGAGVRGDLKAVWLAILTDTEALTLPSSTTAGKLREPMVRLAQIARTFNVSSSTGKWEIYDLSNADTALGQAPLRSPSVFNFFRPGYVPPNTALAAQALVAPEFQLHNETSTAGYINFISNFINNGYADVKLDLSSLESLATDSTALLASLNLHLTASQLSTNTLQLMQTALDVNPVTSSSSTTDKYNRLYAAILLVVSCPEYLIQK